MVIIDDERGLPALVVLGVGAIQLSGDLWEIWGSGRFGASPAAERVRARWPGYFDWRLASCSFRFYFAAYMAVSAACSAAFGSSPARAR